MEPTCLRDSGVRCLPENDDEKGVPCSVVDFEDDEEEEDPSAVILCDEVSEGAEHSIHKSNGFPNTRRRVKRDKRNRFVDVELGPIRGKKAKDRRGVEEGSNEDDEDVADVSCCLLNTFEERRECLYGVCPSQSVILRQEEIKDPWMLDMASKSGSSTEFILSGYRTKLSFAKCTRSIFQLHNETINIWTHLVGAIVWMTMVDATRALLRDRYGADPFTVKLTEWTYYMCILMPLASSAYHTYKCLDERISHILLCTDIAGIHVLMFARTMMEGYLVFYCRPDVWGNLMMLSSLAAIALAAYGSLRPHQQWPFIPAVLMAHVPLLSFVLFPDRSQEGDDDENLSSYVFLSSSGSIVGVVAFVLFMYRFPECRWPGHFDIVGSSHQWWHVFTWLGPSLVLLGMIHLTIFRATAGGCSA